MNVDSTVCMNCSRFHQRWVIGMNLHLALACLMSLVIQPMLAGGLLAKAGGDDGATAALPERGSPPSPAWPRAAQEAQPAKEILADNSSSQPAIADTPDTKNAPEEVSAKHSSGFVRGDAEAVNQSEVAAGAEVVAEAEVRELSVQPAAKPLLPADRPSWVSAPPDLSTSTHRLFVGSFPTAASEEADKALDEPLLAAVIGYVDETVLEDNGARRLDISADYIRKNLIDDSTSYMAELTTSHGPLYQKWVVLRITAEHRKHFTEMHRQLEQQRRMVGLGGGLLGVLGLTGALNLLFNRRRRRYGNSLPPGTYAFIHEEVPPVAVQPKRRSKLTLPVAFGVVAAVTMLGVVVVRKTRSGAPATAVTVNTYPQYQPYAEQMPLNTVEVYTVPLDIPHHNMSRDHSIRLYQDDSGAISVE